MNRVEKGVGVGIVAAIVLAFGGWYVWKMNHHAATAVTQSASLHTISEPLAPDGNPVLFDGDSPVRQQYLATLETQVTPASSATSNVAAVGIIAAVKGSTITLEQFEPQLSSTSGDIGTPTQTAVSILHALPGITIDSSKPITASGSWFCPSTHYSTSG